MRLSLSRIISGFAVVTLLWGGTAAGPAVAEDVKVVLDWVIGAKHAAFLLARDEGFYKQAGMDVSLSRGYGSGGSGKLLAQGKADFSFIDFGTLVLLRSQGAMIKQIAAIHAINPVGYVALRSRGIKEPKDLVGKIFGGGAAASTTFILPTFFKRAGVDPNSVKVTHMAITSIIPSFMAGNIDLFGVYTINSLPILRNNLKERGLDPDKELTLFLAVDYGLDAYSNGLTARDDMIKGNPDLVRRWARATMKAFRETVKHPEKSLENFTTQFPLVKRAVASDELDGMIRSLLSPEARQTALGWSTEEKVRITQDMMFEADQIKGAKQPLGDLYTNDFLEKRPVTQEEIPPKYRPIGLR